MTDISIRINRIKLKRLELGYTQATLAEKVQVTRQTITLIESDKFNPSLKLCIEIAKALQTDLNSLFWEEPDA